MITRREFALGAVAATSAALASRVLGAVDVATADPFCLVPAPRWSDPATWGGAVPAAGASVVLPTTTVVLDVDAQVGELLIPEGATLMFDPTTSRTLTATGNVVVNGTLRMRPTSAAVVQTLRFVGVNESAYVGGGMAPLASDVGLWVTMNGDLDAVGTARTAWARLAAPVAVGGQTLELAQAPTGWQVGDVVTIAPTQRGHFDQYDQRTITTIAGPLVTLSAPSTNAHPMVELEPGFAVGAEVLNLTRTVNIEGTASGRAHVFVSSTRPVNIAHVALRYLGPRKPTGEVVYPNVPVTAGVLGRYPLHIHMMGDAARGSTVTNVLAHLCGNHGFVAHASHGVTFAGCVAHDIVDDAFWWDPPDPTNDTTYQSCVASLLRCSPVFRGYRLCGFLLAGGTGNRVLDCAAVGNLGNKNASGFQWLEMSPQLVDASVWDFRRNVAHNNRAAGIFTWQNTGAAHKAEDFACYNNGLAGIQHGAYVNNYTYRNGWLVGNGKGIEVHSLSTQAGQTVFERLRIDGVGQSAVAITSEGHTLPGPANVFLGLELVGHTGADYVSNAVAGQPDQADLVGCGVDTVTFPTGGMSASAIRVQNGTTATRWAPSGVTVIAPFSTYVPTPRVPFQLVVAA